MRKFLFLAAASWITSLTFTLHQVSLSSHPVSVSSVERPSVDGGAPAESISPRYEALLDGMLSFLNELTTPSAPKVILPDVEQTIAPRHFVNTQITPDALIQDTAIMVMPQRVTLALDKGDTLLKLLVDADVSAKEAQTAIDALRDVYDPRNLKEGQQISVLFGGAQNSEFMGLEFNANQLSSVSVARDTEGAFTVRETETPVERRLVAARATIISSLFDAGIGAGVPLSVMSEMLKIYSYNVDFQRDIQPGDSFQIIFERDFKKDGTPVREGAIVFASMTLSGRSMPLYRFEMPDGTVDMFDAQGSSIRKALMRTPIDGARMTSGFGVRRHPILGYSKMHAGVDFGAPKGTPIYAAGDGSIEEVGAKGSYGNYIRIKHTGMISTAYAHMSRFAQGMRRGIRVKQGDIIGYVGSTGRSTGPHLHYEVLRSGRAVNPMSVDMPSGKKLDQKSMRVFEARVHEVGTVFANMVNDGRIQFANLKTEASAEPTSCSSTQTC